MTALHVRCTALHELGPYRGREGSTEAHPKPLSDAPQSRSQNGASGCKTEGVGFEPTSRLRDQRFSRPPRSTTPAPLRTARPGG